tara:strand:+ start:412 stop:804 length:393 start_codon:yes stop_codon:yes gene_type:complete
MNSPQGLGDRDRDIDEFIKQEKDNPNFKEMFKKIMEGGSSKKVENFLRENKEGMDFMQEIPGYLDPRTGEVIREDQQSDFMAMHDYQKDPELRKTLMEIINTPGYDPDSVREAQRQIIRMNQGLPRFPGV